MKVLILGAGGLTGRYLVQEARRRGMEVTGLCHEELDITRPDAAKEVLSKYKPSWVINAASLTSLELCEDDPARSRKINTTAPAEWAKECGKAGVGFVHLGTDYIFDGKKKEAYLPTDPASPLSRYGNDKAEGEKQVLRANPDALIVRLAWVFGHGGKTFMEQGEGNLSRSAAGSDHLEGFCREGGGGDEKKRQKGGVSGDPGAAAGEDSRVEGVQTGVFPVGYGKNGEDFGEEDSGLGKGIGGVFERSRVVSHRPD
ncbi:NAD(P)-dependent oxidoreductase [bacterium]|nr:NAD(P)-dependent oxidoreductase [bacterium]